MSVKLGDAIVYFKGDHSGLKKSQKTARSDTETWSIALGNLISSGVTMGVGLASDAIVGLGKAGWDAIQEAMPAEGIEEAFGGITGADAAETLQALQEGSKGMVTNTELMRSYNQAAQLVGDSFAEDLPEAMAYFSKISAATGDDVDFLIDSYVRGVGRLSPAILDNLQVQASLEEATARAAEMYGKATDELSKQEIQAGMSAVVLEKLAENTEAMPDVTDNAATKWAQFNTELENLRIEVGSELLPILLELLKMALPLLREYGPLFIELIRDIAEGAAKVGEDIGPRLVDVMGRLDKIWERISPHLTKLANALGFSVNEGDDFLGVMLDLVGAVAWGTLGAMLWGVEEALRALAIAGEVSIKIVDGIAGSIEWWKGAVDSLLGVWDPLLDGLEDITGIELPEWLQSHSPPPLATALRDIALAAKALPDLSGTLGGVISPRFAPAYADNRRNITMYGPTFPTTQDAGGFYQQLVELGRV